MTNWLFAHGLTGVTAELNVRFRHPVTAERADEGNRLARAGLTSVVCAQSPYHSERPIESPLQQADSCTKSMVQKGNRSTMRHSMIPTKAFLTRGVGRHRYQLKSFEEALRTPASPNRIWSRSPRLCLRTVASSVRKRGSRDCRPDRSATASWPELTRTNTAG